MRKISPNIIRNILLLAGIALILYVVSSEVNGSSRTAELNNKIDDIDNRLSSRISAPEEELDLISQREKLEKELLDLQ